MTRKLDVFEWIKRDLRPLPFEKESLMALWQPVQLKRRLTPMQSK